MKIVSRNGKLLCPRCGCLIGVEVRESEPPEWIKFHVGRREYPPIKVKDLPPPTCPCCGLEFNNGE